MMEQGPVTRAEKAEELLRWAIKWIEYAGMEPYNGEGEENHWEKYLAAKELLK